MSPRERAQRAIDEMFGGGMRVVDRVDVGVVKDTLVRMLRAAIDDVAVEVENKARELKLPADIAQQLDLHVRALKG